MYTIYITQLQRFNGNFIVVRHKHINLVGLCVLYENVHNKNSILTNLLV